MSETRPILCGKCNVEVKVRIDPNGDKTVICPNCGANDSLESAMRDVGEYLVRKGLREHGIRSTSNITVTHPPERTYRFIPG